MNFLKLNAEPFQIKELENYGTVQYPLPGVDFFDLDGCLLIKEDPYKLISEENGKIFYSYIQ